MIFAYWVEEVGNQSLVELILGACAFGVLYCVAQTISKIKNKGKSQDAKDSDTAFLTYGLMFLIVIIAFIYDANH